MSYGERRMKIPPMYECFVWNHTDAHSTRQCIQWLYTQPRRDTVGYIQIGQQRPHEITHKNRHTWEKILDDCAQELTQFCNICGQEMLEDEYSASDLFCDTCVGEHDRGSSKWDSFSTSSMAKMFMIIKCAATELCRRCRLLPALPPATGASYYKDIEQNEDTTKWYDCPHCDAGYPDQKCICKENEE